MQRLLNMVMMIFIAVVIIAVMAICSTAPCISRHNECPPKCIPTWGHLRESINDVDDGKDYWYGTLVEATYQCGMDLHTT